MSEEKLVWEQEAKNHIDKAPFFIRKFVRRKVEKAATEHKIERITIEFVEMIRNKESSL